MAFWKKYALQAWLPTISLGFAAFIFVTTEMLPVGLLPDIADSLGKSEAATGILLTVYAWMVALMSVPLTVLSGNINRRTLVLVLLAVFILGNFFSALAATFMMLMAARIFIALAHAVFWSIATPLAARAAPEGGKARALSIIVTGTSLATVLGVPLGTLLGHQFGWRVTFAVVALVACAVFAVMWFLLPSTPAANSGSFRSLTDIARNRSLMAIYLITLVTVTGHFTAFTYFSPFMTQIGGYTPGTVALLLLMLGGSGIVGSIVGSRFAEKKSRLNLFIPLCLMASLFLALQPATQLGLLATAALCFVWGATFTFVTLIFQLRVLGLSPKAVDVAVAIYCGTFNIGIGGGALLGSQIFDRLGIGINPLAAALCMALAALLSLTPAIARSIEPGKKD